MTSANIPDAARGIESKKSEFNSEKGLKAVLERDWDLLERVELEVIISQIRATDEGIKKLEKQITESGRQMEGQSESDKHQRDRPQIGGDSAKRNW